MASSRTISPPRVEETVKRHLIGDGFPIVFDLERSHGSWIVDARNGDEYLDLYTFFASLPLGFRHPVFDVHENRERLASVAELKPANSDAHTCELAHFVRTFSEHALPADFRHLFFVEGGALAVENALKAAFDWKVHKNLAAGRGEIGGKILHFREAFHGRSGYTMSLTNTDPVKIAHFPKFDWPRIGNPALRFPIDDAELDRVAAAEREAVAEAEAAFAAHRHDIAGIIIEPIQGEGGDNHFRREFFLELRRLADENDALLIFDEVQTGFGGTGRMWAWEHFDVAPDLLSFGKKAQVCGVMAGPRLDEVEENVFRKSSRINSTWGGGLVDMVRCELILETMAHDDLVGNAARVGEHLLTGLHDVSGDHPDFVSNVRGRGLMCAFDCLGGAERDALLTRLLDEKVLGLACGERSLRFRPALTFSIDEADETVRRLRRAVERL